MSLKFRSSEYENFLDFLADRFKIIMLKDNEFAEANTCMLRHDVDSQLDVGLQMAKIERDKGIASTYFVFTSTHHHPRDFEISMTPQYFQQEDFIEKCLQIQDMGHEIGLHNNIMVRCAVKWSTNVTPEEVLTKELNYLRENGLRVYGTSSHGDMMCRARTYVTFRNYQIFKSCIPPYKHHEPEVPYGIPLHTIDLNEHHLYEAYFLDHECYITDTPRKGIWRGSCMKEYRDDWAPNFKAKTNVPIRKFLDQLKGIIQVNIHTGSRIQGHYGGG